MDCSTASATVVEEVEFQDAVTFVDELGDEYELSGYKKGDTVDMLSYRTEDEALSDMCSTCLAYSAYAFEAKYITQDYPNLRLPVSGPKYTWDV